MLHGISKHCFFIQFYMVFNKFYYVFVNGMTSLSRMVFFISSRLFIGLMMVWM